MPGNLRLAYFAHSLRSDWNNGNAHFLRGLMRAMVAIGHVVVIFEPAKGWSIDNLAAEPLAKQSMAGFEQTYSELDVRTYADEDQDARWLQRLEGFDVVVLHEWNPPELARRLLRLRDELGLRLLFHDTHHRASSTPEQIRLFGLDEFDGIIAFGEALRTIYRTRFGMRQVWTLHEAADTTVFKPLLHRGKEMDVVWIGNWGEGERSREIRRFFLEPAGALAGSARFTIFGVRYPEDGLQALAEADVRYRGYLPNLYAPETYAKARLTLHIPRQEYATAMAGIPTIRVFEALACGIPLISAPWEDREELFRPGDFLFAKDGGEMKAAIETLLSDPAQAAEQAQRGLETVLARHTCRHRAAELTAICQETLS